MRLIDADELIQKLYEMKAKEEQYIGLENDVSVAIGSIGFEVMNMPTVYDMENSDSRSFLTTDQVHDLCTEAMIKGKADAIDEFVKLVIEYGISNGYVDAESFIELAEQLKDSK